MCHPLTPLWVNVLYITTEDNIQILRYFIISETASRGGIHGTDGQAQAHTDTHRHTRAQKHTKYTHSETHIHRHTEAYQLRTGTHKVSTGTHPHTHGHYKSHFLYRRKQAERRPLTKQRSQHPYDVSLVTTAVRPRSRAEAPDGQSATHWTRS